MKNKLFLSFIFLLYSVVSYSQGYHVRIGVIGNSITQGTTPTNAYPAQLGILLEEIYGDTCIVTNFGIHSTTMLKKGDVPYWNSSQFKDYMAWAPELCFLMLGTNDSKPQNWDLHSNEFIDDYIAMIDTILDRNPSTKFMIGYPPPAFDVVWGIRDSVIINGVIPAIDSVLTLRNADTVDFYNPLLDSVHLFPDYIHPNAVGELLMATMIRDRMIATDFIHQADTGLTFVTKFTTSKTPILVGDSATLSWTTINADSVLLNGQKVSKDGNQKVSPVTTIKYTLIAYGKLSNDTLSLTQEMYVPVLSELRIYPSSKTMLNDDTLKLQVRYYDQMSKIINDTVYDVQWGILSGGGSFYDQSGTSTYFVSVSVADTTEVEITFDTLSAKATIITKVAISDIVQTQKKSEFNLFPNPANDILYLQLQDVDYPLNILIYDMKGVIRNLEEFQEITQTENTHNLDIKNLPAGTYILHIKNSEGIIGEKVFIINR